MDEPVPASDSATPANVAGTPPRQGPFAQPVSRGLVMALAIGLVLVVGAVWFAGHEAQRTLRTEVAKRLTDADAALAQAKARESDLANELREAQAKLALLEARLSESQSQQASLEALYRELAPSRDELALNEVEQVLLACEPAARHRRQRAGGAGGAATRRRQARARRPAAARRAAPRARARHRPAEVGAVRRRVRDVAQARPGDRRRSTRCRSPRTSACRRRWRRRLRPTSPSGGGSCATRGPK